VSSAALSLQMKASDSSDEFDFYFQTFYNARRPVLMSQHKGWKPATDVYETDDEVVIVVDIASISTSDIRLTLQGQVLTLRGLRRELPVDEKRHYHNMEIDFGPFERRIDLPARVDPDRSVKRYLQGFLEVRLPKLDLLQIERRDLEIDL